MATVDALVEEFRLAAIQKGQEGGPLDGELFDRLRLSYRQLRSQATEGIRAFRSMLRDPSPSVRVWVAAQLLAEGNVEALEVLEALAKQEGLLGFNAQMTIREHEAGRLKPPFGEAAA